MISKLSEKAVATLFANEEFNEGDRELYIYGFFMLFSHLFFLTLTIFYGFLFGIIFESIVFHVIFTVLRGYAGGVHASTEKVCTLSTSLSLLFCVALIRMLDAISTIFIPALMLISSMAIIFMLSPLDSNEKPLTEDEKSFYRKKSCIFSVLVFSVAVIMLGYGFYNIFCCCAVAFFFESILLFLGKIQKGSLK